MKNLEDYPLCKSVFCFSFESQHKEITDIDEIIEIVIEKVLTTICSTRRIDRLIHTFHQLRDKSDELWFKNGVPDIETLEEKLWFFSDYIRVILDYDLINLVKISEEENEKIKEEYKNLNKKN